MTKKKCVYCDEDDSSRSIMSPNCDEGVWEVCDFCSEVIREQQQLDFGNQLASSSDGGAKEYGERIVRDATDRLDALSKKRGISILSACVSKKRTGGFSVSSMEFTGVK